jgi:ADP-ribose pyrophosphatase
LKVLPVPTPEQPSAKNSPHYYVTQAPGALTETTLSSQQVYTGRVITVKKDQVRHPSGAIVEREVAEHPGGVVVYPVLADGRLVLVEQWRYPLQGTLLEFPAGKLDWTDGVAEDPLQAVQRELFEETGYEAQTWQAVTAIYTAPGFCNEKLWLFKAESLFNGEKAHQPSDQEWLNVVLLTPEEVLEKIKTGCITDAKTIALFSLCFYIQ